VKLGVLLLAWCLLVWPNRVVGVATAAARITDLLHWSCTRRSEGGAGGSNER